MQTCRVAQSASVLHSRQQCSATRSKRYSARNAPMYLSSSSKKGSAEVPLLSAEQTQAESQPKRTTRPDHDAACMSTQMKMA